ncbi:peptidoglycan DD-metalloendopeptidase family protein [Rhizobium sp. P40RR-XXII]|uniref:M23 family metallopeptidase n=1 Tax=unclassified Rhizobium TaxID=2613769 RepID=UPI00145780DD|nr:MULTISPECIES: M23 family metallopeptidase [unclassified Rhizobium]NLR83419.1 peptidoglycan DD-metalloendopeptidase family protein [Rhizobium sp. P28RR-XV]NLS15839.1 peptidoglycan DD-metalloendopeptidase family protein [Rhizobium sp. P40RR-XXII]
MTAKPQNRVFGKQQRHHTIILASGDTVRHMTVRPWMAAGAVCLAGIFSISYLLATSYLVLRDDLISATMARQARMQYDYEDRIAALRAQVDRVTSRQLLDQQVVEEKVDKLIEQQQQLSSRNGKLGTLLDRAESSGLTGQHPDANAASGNEHAQLTTPKAIEKLLLGGKPADATPDNSTLAYVPAPETVADRADRVFSKVTLSLKHIEQDQLTRIHNLTADASGTANEIQTIMHNVGIRVPNEVAAAKGEDADGVGGPYVPPENVDRFEQSMADLDTALTHLEIVRGAAESLPFRNPAAGKLVTSPFGNRKDPFFGTLALHTGTDFHFSPGEKIKATAPGKVIAAGWTGGYGNMVEIDHGDGISTRYGHMEQILVKVGDKVGTGAVVGLAGSTGRSTGTHLHYEVRENGHPVDPMYFINAGTKLASYISGLGAI